MIRGGLIDREGPRPKVGGFLQDPAIVQALAATEASLAQLTVAKS